MRLPWRKNKDQEERAAPEQTMTEAGVFDNESDLFYAMIGSITMTKQKALKIPAVSASVNKIAASVAAVPFKLYEKNGSSIIEHPDDNRLSLINKDTRDTLDANQFWRAMVEDYFLDKGAYAYISRDMWTYEPWSLNHVEPDNISFMTNNDPIHKEYTIMINGQRYFPFEFIKLLRNTKKGWKSRSMIQENMAIFQVAYAGLDFEGSIYNKGGTKKGFIVADNPITEQAKKEIRAAFKNVYGNGSESVIVLSNGAKFQESSNTAAEMQVNENKKTNYDVIYSLFGIPPRIMNGVGTAIDRQNYIDSAVKPFLDAKKTALNRELLWEHEKSSFYFDYDPAELLKTDIGARYEAYKTGIESGFLQVDEVRKKENMQELGMPYVKLGLQDVLFDPESKVVYTINTDKTVKLDDMKKGGMGNNED